MDFPRLSRFAALVPLAFLAACGGAEEPPAPPPAPPPPAPRAAPRLFPMEAAPLLDDPGRDEWQKPAEVVAALDIRPGQRIADVGCGTGYFTMRLLRAAGPTGHVIAVDVQQGMLDLLERRLKPDERSRVTLRRNPPDRPLERGDRVDLVLCANTLYEVEEADAARFMKSIADGLVLGGRLAVVDWIPAKTRLGPPVAVRITPDRIRELAAAASLAPSQEHKFLPMHAFLVFTRVR